MGAPNHTAEVVRLYREGKSLKDIGATVGLHFTWVWRLLRDAGEPRRPRGAPRIPAVDTAAAEVRETGCRVADAAYSHGVSEGVVYRRLREAECRNHPVTPEG